MGSLENEEVKDARLEAGESSEKVESVQYSKDIAATLDGLRSGSNEDLMNALKADFKKKLEENGSTAILEEKEGLTYNALYQADLMLNLELSDSDKEKINKVLENGIESISISERPHLAVAFGRINAHRGGNNYLESSISTLENKLYRNTSKIYILTLPENGVRSLISNPSTYINLRARFEEFFRNYSNRSIFMWSLSFKNLKDKFESLPTEITDANSAELNEFINALKEFQNKFSGKYLDIFGVRDMHLRHRRSDLKYRLEKSSTDVLDSIEVSGGEKLSDKEFANLIISEIAKRENKFAPDQVIEKAKGELVLDALDMSFAPELVGEIPEGEVANDDDVAEEVVESGEIEEGATEGAEGAEVVNFADRREKKEEEKKNVKAKERMVELKAEVYFQTNVKEFSYILGGNVVKPFEKLELKDVEGGKIEEVVGEMGTQDAMLFLAIMKEEKNKNSRLYEIVFDKFKKEAPENFEGNVSALFEKKMDDASRIVSGLLSAAGMVKKENKKEMVSYVERKADYLIKRYKYGLESNKDFARKYTEILDFVRKNELSKHVNIPMRGLALRFKMARPFHRFMTDFKLKRSVAKKVDKQISGEIWQKRRKRFGKALSVMTLPRHLVTNKIQQFANIFRFVEKDVPSVVERFKGKIEDISKIGGEISVLKSKDYRQKRIQVEMDSERDDLNAEFEASALTTKDLDKHFRSQASTGVSSLLDFKGAAGDGAVAGAQSVKKAA